MISVRMRAACVALSRPPPERRPRRLSLSARSPPSRSSRIHLLTASGQEQEELFLVARREIEEEVLGLGAGDRREHASAFAGQADQAAEEVASRVGRRV